MEEPLTAAFAARIKPGEDGVRTLVLRAAWRRTEESRYPWTLRLDDGAAVTEYDAAVPDGLRRQRLSVRLSGACPGGLSLHRLAERQRRGGGYPSAADFFVRSADGQTDWQAPPVTLTAQWEQE